MAIWRKFSFRCRINKTKQTSDWRSRFRKCTETRILIKTVFKLKVCRTPFIAKLFKRIWYRIARYKGSKLYYGAINRILTHLIVTLSLISLFASIGCLPVMSSTSNTPKEYTSLFSVSWYVLRYSGSKYPAVPLTWVETCVTLESSRTRRANPKSATFARSLSVIRMFVAFMSLWIIGASVSYIIKFLDSDFLSFLQQELVCILK